MQRHHSVRDHGLVHIPDPLVGQQGAVPDDHHHTQQIPHHIAEEMRLLVSDFVNTQQIVSSHLCRARHEVVISVSVP